MRSCMFCEGRAHTKEHAWPEWLIKLIDQPGMYEVQAERGKTELDGWTQVRPELTVKWVCGSCNNGWMSGLEGRTRPIVQQMLGLAPMELPVDDQRTLGIWGVKTAMVFEALRRDRGWFYTQDERDLFRRELRPPPRTAVWVASAAAVNGAYCAAADASECSDENPDAVRAYITTMAFGPLALQVITLRVPPHIPAHVAVTTDVQPGQWSECTRQVWPVSAGPLGWPPSTALNGEIGVEALGRRFKVGDGE